MRSQTDVRVKVLQANLAQPSWDAHSNTILNQKITRGFPEGPCLSQCTKQRTKSKKYLSNKERSEVLLYFYCSRLTLNSKSTIFKSFSEDRADHDQVNYSSTVSETSTNINEFFSHCCCQRKGHQYLNFTGEQPKHSTIKVLNH